ncbi:MAG: PDZ domain-containing protein [Candidatus Eremiobacteraeota bacterium]|nr:PDZ domain-containing protein [Candidatus Eremiobacteraeota bacterium]
METEVKMHRLPPHLRLVAGRMLLAVIFAWAAGALVVSASFLWTPRGTFGLTAGYGARVMAVAAHSPAAAAGIATGDRIDLGGTPFDSRPFLVGVTAPYPPGARVSLRFLHEGIERSAVLTAVKEDEDNPTRVALGFAIVSSMLFLIVGTGLIFWRESAATWGFGLYCLLTNPVIASLSRFPSAAAHLGYVALYDIVQNVGVVGLLVFALNFPRALKRPWRRTLRRLLPVIFVVLAAWTLWIDLAVCVFGIPVGLSNRFLQLGFGLIDVAAIALITETYLAGPVEDRARLRWVLIGFYIGLLCNFIGNVLLYTANVVLPLWLDTLLIALVVSLPLTVAYAVVRHRVIDTDFFLSRAIVYALFTSVLVMVFAVIDWLFSRLLADFRLSLFIEALVSIGAAISFDAVHKRVERTVDELLFRGRRLARERLERAARAVRHATLPSSIDRLMVDEPKEALGLVSVALFRREGDGFRRVSADGWPPGTLERLDDDDRLVLEHHATNDRVVLAALPWNRDGLPHGVSHPSLSLPLESRASLEGFLLCSGTAHGEQLDPEESEWVEQLVSAAATAYEELETEQLRERVTSAEDQLRVLGAQLDEARRAAVAGASYLPTASAVPPG